MKSIESDALDGERAITTRQAGELLGLAAITMQQMRARGEGPRFFRAGARHVRYRLADVIDYRNSRMAGKAMRP